MATSRELSRLFEAIADDSRDASIALAHSIAEEEAKKGHLEVAKKLRSALVGTGNARTVQRLTATVGQTPFLSKALHSPSEKFSLSDVQMRGSIRSIFEDLLLEFRSRRIVEANGLKVRNKILLTGPPGCGKSMTARAFATELELPFFVVRLDAIIGAYLGQTANNLRELFAFAANNRCVLLIDELDALGKQRGSYQDVGELDRIVIAMLQELEFFSADGILIATSNLQKSLDAALWRRFDLAISFPKPTKLELSKFAKVKCSAFGIPYTRTLRSELLTITNFADAIRVVENAARRSILGGTHASA